MSKISAIVTRLIWFHIVHISSSHNIGDIHLLLSCKKRSQPYSSLSPHCSPRQFLLCFIFKNMLKDNFPNNNRNAGLRFTLGDYNGICVESRRK